MNEKPSQEAWLDFQSIKNGADVERVLAQLGILEHLQRRGDELVGWCPLGDEHGKGDSFSFNTAKKSFQCFACKARGSVLDFVRKYDGSDLRAAAIRVQEIMGEAASPSPAPAPAKKSRPYGKAVAGKTEAPAARIVPKAGKSAESSSHMMGWREACARVKDETLDANALIVIDVRSLEWLASYMSGEESAGETR